MDGIADWLHPQQRRQFISIAGQVGITRGMRPGNLAFHAVTLGIIDPSFATETSCCY